jgi:hypothetical protein
MQTLLSKPSANFKVNKNLAYGYYTPILHLAPHDLSGRNVCKKATAGCAAACLNPAGRGAMNTIQQARIKKTNTFFNDYNNFMIQLKKEITSAKKTAKNKGLKLAIRLNGTSDILWENSGIMDAFPDVQFYDYTKYSNRKRLPANYHLTFSKADGNDNDVKKAMKNGLNIAVVFQNYLPKSYLGRPVVDGDKNDLRFLDGKNVIIGLLAKGKAKKDNTGFVVKQGGQNE